MRAVVQRVSSAEVEVEGKIVGQITQGLLILLGCQEGDQSATAVQMAAQIAKLRIFEDPEGRTNLDIFAAGGEILLVSQFTLAADLRKGNRPSFTSALAPAKAKVLVEDVAQELSNKGLKVEQGVFGATMDVRSCNRGPATYLIDV
jgi:D-tyrosyl-tRNA(Tyr) deacylase